MRWPRGRYNNQPIMGVNVSFSIDARWIIWLPVVKWNWGAPMFLWLIFAIRVQALYGDRPTPSNDA